jgi:hypothetical protein
MIAFIKHKGHEGHKGLQNDFLVSLFYPTDAVQ